MTQDHFREIYANQGALYDRMVAREDYKHQLLPTLQALHSLENTTVVEFGAGTGRLTRLLAPHVRRIHAFDFSAHMLQNARPTLPDTANWTLAVSENRRMPLPAAVCDLAIEGWSFGHATGWYPESWRDHIGAAVAEMQRITRPGGTMVIIETLGTGSETPNAPSRLLSEFYQWLEEVHGFTHTWIRTDIKFESVEEADRLTRFFFGDAFADDVFQKGRTIVPECTGVWWCRR
jgi:ubiquinone/menaquinone biosynthesis C-methylase UbiE